MHEQRQEVMDAIFERLEIGEDRSWKTLRARFPKVPPSTFWRWLKQARETCERTPPLVIGIERRERQAADARRELYSTALLMRRHAVGQDGELMDRNLLVQSAKWMDEYRRQLEVLDPRPHYLSLFWEAVTEEVVAENERDHEAGKRLVQLLRKATQRMSERRPAGPRHA